MHTEAAQPDHRPISEASAMTSSIRILLVGEQPVFREGLTTLFEREGGFTVVGAAAEPEETVKAIRDLEPDVLLVSLTGRLLARVLQTLHVLTVAGHSARTIVLTASTPKNQFAQWQQLGVCGILLKDTSAGVMFESVRSVAAGRCWLGHEPLEDLRAAIEQRSAAGAHPSGLTPREREIVDAVRRGATNRHIASELGITLDTVKHHIANIFTKVGVLTRLQLAVFAMDREGSDDRGLSGPTAS
jgi:two-component system, NarL family, nitrate/nitrite response regulator NarL